MQSTDAFAWSSLFYTVNNQTQDPQQVAKMTVYILLYLRTGTDVTFICLICNV